MRLTYLISADYARTTGGWIYNERLLCELAILGWRIDRIELAAGFPDPPPDVIVSASAVLSALPDRTLVLADQVVLAPLADSVQAAAGRLNVAMLMHHPQVLEGSRPPALAASMDAAERLALAHVARVIATSRATARQMISDYRVEAARLILAEPGTDELPPSGGSGGPGLHLLSLGSVIPRKRHELIVAALSGLADLDWCLTIAGSLAMNETHVGRLRHVIEAGGLAQRITLTGALTGMELEAVWQATDLYVASSVHEGFGMALAEAIARRIPVVSTRSGAVGDWLDPRASILVEPDDAETMRAALRHVLTQPQRLAEMRAGTKAARQSLPTWPQSALTVSHALRTLA